MNLHMQYRRAAYAILLTLAVVPFAAFGSHGGRDTGGSGGGGGTAQDVCSVVAPGGQPTQIVPGTVLIRDTFGPGPQFARPEGGSGSLHQVNVNTGNDGGSDISGFWAEQPCSNTVVWMGPTGGGAKSWIFQLSPIDPKEPPSNMLPPGVGNVRLAVNRAPDDALEHPVALVPFQAPSIPYEVSVDTPPVVPPGDWFDVGFTASNALNDNFESAGQAWIRVKYADTQDPVFATVELHTDGLSGPSISAVLPIDPSSWDTLTVQYDPVLRLVTGYYNGQAIGTLPYDASSARYAGFEGDNVADNFVLKASK